MSKRPLVSVVIPVHNTEPYLKQCLNSVLGQTLTNIEVICVDDASTDSSLSILNEYAAADSRVRVFSQNNGGAGAARNLGLEHAAGVYLSFLDSDDFFESEMLEKSAKRANETEADITVFGAWLYDGSRDANRQAKWVLDTEHLPNAEPFEPQAIQDYLFNAFGNYTWNKLFRADFIKSNDIEFQRISRTNDLLFTCSALAKASKIATVDQCFVHYRIATTTSLQSTNDRDPLSFVKAFDALYEFLCGNGLFDIYKTSFYNHLIDAVCSNADSLKTLKGLECISASVREHIEPEYDICNRNSELIRNRVQFNQYQTLLSTDTDAYLFRRTKALQSQLEDAYWYTDWCEWRKWTLENETGDLRNEIDSLKHTVEELQERIVAFENRRVVRLADSVHALLSK